MDNERKIEKLLRDYAKKRRAAAGDSVKLHPVTRLLLQGEVARRFAEPPEEESVSLWQLFRQQWAFLTMFVMVIFFGTALLFPALSKAKMKAKTTVAMSQLKEIGAAAQIAAAENNGRLPASLDSLTNRLVSQKALTDPVSGKPFVYVAGGEILDQLVTNSVLAYSPTDKKDRAVLLADGRVQTMKTEEFDTLTRRGLVQREVTLNDGLAMNHPAAVAAPAVVAPETLTAGSVINGAVGGARANSDTEQLATLASAEKKVASQTEPAAAQLGLNQNSQRYMQAAVAQAATPPVLVSFEVQQSGNALSVVDRDGSVYSGSIQPESLTDQSTILVPPALAKANDFSAAKNESVLTQNSQNNYFFRVAGQNRTSKQNVVFSGNLIPLSNATANAVQNFQGSNANVLSNSRAAANMLSQSLFSNSRIKGTVTVDATNQIEINAVPVAP